MRSVDKSSLDNVKQIPCEHRAGWHRHPLGGGWIQDTAKVADTVFVGSEASVEGAAEATDYVRLLDRAVLADQAIARDYAVICGHARVSYSAIIDEHAVVGGRSRVEIDGRVSGNAVIGDCGRVDRKGVVSGRAVVLGSAVVCNSLVAGFAVLGGDVVVKSNAQLFEGRFDTGVVEGNQGQPKK
jgi:NDP-sugar pyrophosphorylase family protein